MEFDKFHFFNANQICLTLWQLTRFYKQKQYLIEMVHILELKHFKENFKPLKSNMFHNVLIN